MESLFDLWGKRDPEWEKKYQDTVLIPFTDYGKGVNQYQDVRGKIFGPGYEMFILAFFIGLYYDQTKPLVEDKATRKHFGWPICEWGSREARLGRTKYSDLQRYMYAANTPTSVSTTFRRNWRIIPTTSSKRPLFCVCSSDS